MWESKMWAYTHQLKLAAKANRLRPVPIAEPRQ